MNVPSGLYATAGVVGVMIRLGCAVCNEWCLGAVCADCTVLRHAMTLYGKQEVLARVNQIFVRNSAGLAKQTAAIKKSDADEAQATTH